MQFKLSEDQKLFFEDEIFLHDGQIEHYEIVKLPSGSTMTILRTPFKILYNDTSKIGKSRICNSNSMYFNIDEYRYDLLPN